VHNSQEDKYAAEFNGNRIRLGIPPLPNNWQLANSPTNEIVWQNPSWREHKPGHVYKSLTFSENRLVSEADSYFSGREFPAMDPDAKTDPETLTIAFKFSSAELADGIRECTLLTSTGVTNISYEAATNLIYKWTANEDQN